MKTKNPKTEKIHKLASNFCPPFSEKENLKPPKIKERGWLTSKLYKDLTKAIAL